MRTNGVKSGVSGGAWVAVVVVAALLAWGGGTAGAGKPQPPSPPPTVDTGTIYYGSSVQDSWSMAPDGTGKTDIDSLGQPTDDVHKSPISGTNVRWFLQLLPVGSGTYPSGMEYHEWFAVSDEGDQVQLTNGISDDSAVEIEASHWFTTPNVIARAEPQWATDINVVDGKISFLGLKWANDILVEAGLYTVAVDWSVIEAGGTYSAAEPELFLALDTCTIDVNEGGKPYLWAYYDWSPDGAEVVYCNRGVVEDESPEIFIASTSGETSLYVYGVKPCWSAKNVIAYLVGNSQTIRTVLDSGSGVTTIATTADTRKEFRNFDALCWSPGGTNLVYTHLARPKSLDSAHVYSIYRVAADGSGKTLLVQSSTYPGTGYSPCIAYAWVK